MAGFKLSRVARTDLAQHQRLVRSAYDDILKTIEAYNERVAAATGWVEDQVSEWREEFDSKSERWQESDRGDEVNSHLEDWQAVAEMTDEMDAPDASFVEAMEGLEELDA